MSKKTFRVFAEVTTSCYLDVEAETEEEALAIGQDADGGEFTTQDDDGYWDVYSAVEISEIEARKGQ